MHIVATATLPHAWLIFAARFVGDIVILTAPDAYPDVETEAREIDAAIDELEGKT